MRRARTHAAVAIALLPLLVGVRDAAAQNVPDLVTADVLRVCGDPGNMPFSERKEDGFENRIAAIIADELKIKVRYYWLTQGPGFVRNTLGTGLCDLIVGSALGSEGVQNTNPYYRSVYTLIVKQGDLAGVSGLDDPKLKGKRIGVIAGTPPVNRMGDLGLISSMKAYAPYQLDPARKNQTVGAEIVSDLAAGQIDAAVLWGPSAGWLAKQSGTAMDVIPLLKEPDRPPMSYRIAMAVRIGENDWKRSLNTILRKRRSDIEAVLRDFDVPLLEEEENKLLAPNAH
ncbi:quinoprotein dehydrogenase-associated putative ABC transporter substrate-binding protein [Methylobacterium sp. WL30]|jgi:quinoprotein dehydrogenase-associated probable ABC transporter substrate-binding protein|uniref:rare earth element methanol dehydrogenase accessory protein XoxJ n=1 Tax=unclassified Methylobacterium TaxID=2615210 RepID=UPI0011CBBCB9|nr:MULTISPECIES: rare earth element methanol dehydrogenase accessory protein XoxJ [unclassified Methylobacterium]MCJ2076138.1 substrate-binding domain-containing protein [Methylobacterium sp. E-016]TXM94327.1 quinoprotein dehydrogenase-associated putative ABC transporter substrate-binding protein [Methylobacterium sp. WL116]TXN38669.1 quinoprotein dehydrogenase-associated putative ABC transporter substrate-binding protein [Methylobacterium sp. WL93]TXN46977.1 quinoprotein dehydrogenase-associat